jgi:hypothetical protein
MVNNSTNINKTNNNLSPQITTYDVVNAGPSLGQQYKCGRVKPINGIPTLPLLIIGSSMAMLV